MELVKGCDEISTTKYKEKILPDPINGLGKNKFEKTSNESIHNMVKSLSNATTLFLYLKHNKATWDRNKYNGSKTDKFDLYNKYFKAQGKICTSISEQVMAKHLNVSIKTIYRWIKKLEEIGFIETEKIELGSGENYKTYNIYVLGRVVDGHRKYYADILPPISRT